MKKSQLQFGFTAGTSILSASIMLSEVTERSANLSTVAVFLDAEKAFDVVWQDSLLRKL